MYNTTCTKDYVLLDWILCQFNSYYICTNYFPKIHFNISLLSPPFSRWPLFKILHDNVTHISCFPSITVNAQRTQIITADGRKNQQNEGRNLHSSTAIWSTILLVMNLITSIIVLSRVCK